MFAVDMEITVDIDKRTRDGIESDDKSKGGQPSTQTEWKKERKKERNRNK